jgi:hypothetical protein
MAIIIHKVGEHQYYAILHLGGPEQQTPSMSERELFVRLESRGCHPVDIDDALDAANRRAESSHHK